MKGGTIITQTISFDELAVLSGSAAGLRAALNDLAAALSSVGDAGGQTREVLDALQSGIKATAAQSAKAVRSLAKFDEINRLAAPKAETETADAAKTARETKTGQTDRKAAEAQSALDSLRPLLDSLRALWADFWAYLQTFYAPAIAAWSAAWGRLQTAALAVWEPVKTAALGLWRDALAPLGTYLATVFLPGVVNSFSAAFAPLAGGAAVAAVTALGNTFTWLCGLLGEAVHTVALPALELLLAVWQGLMDGIRSSWAAYGQPVLDGAVLACQNLCAVLTALWSAVVQPVLQRLIALLGELWQNHLLPLWQSAAQALGAVAQLVLTVWNTVLAPLAAWLISAFGPVFTQVFAVAAQAVAAAAALVVDAVNLALTVLRGLADFVTAVLRGSWDAAWNSMAATVSAVWQRITATVQDAINHVKGIVNGMLDVIASAVNAVLQTIARLKSAASGAVSGAQTALRGRAVPAASFRVPALAAGAVIPPNREFLALLGDQRGGTNIEAPLETIRQAFAETLAALGGGDAQPINIYIGEELLDSVIAASQNRRTLRSGGR